ncbi:MAG: HAD family phosphatase [Chloroflexi bacterium]|nr:HAD family phosphatase [Chloroflexota bacterium]
MTASYRAVVFDMDGVLVDSEPVFFEAVNELLKPAGKRIDWEDYQHLLGSTMSHTWHSVLETVGLDANEAQQYLDGYSDTLIELLRRPRSLLPGVEPLIADLRRQRIPIAVATASRLAWVEAVLGEGAGVPLETFDAVVSREQVENGKPAPDLYLRAAELLSTPPERCIAIEDTIPGIASAKAAGMYAIQVRASSTALPPIDAADLVLDSLHDFPFDLVTPPKSV